ncbi:tyrosine-tRNA ligase [Pholiota conissans]|uniref:Tyrosine--tRNA ligase n=1 Tax=Pholiota conissans TaxID=109636 RepID=A0A9P5YME3_9AGAR|nr:tyrosine-tRNA ligase [Pholiota conissans]
MRYSRLASRKLLCLVHQRHHHAVSLLEDLSQRGFIQDVTRRDALEGALHTKKQTIYAGVDPTAKSLHIGHLIPLLTLLHFHIHGHNVIPIIGGATGRVGDPSGRLVERQLADIQQVEYNVSNLTTSIQHFFKRALLYAGSRLQPDQSIPIDPPTVVNNLNWHGSFGLLDFLQKIGVHVRVNTMLNRESVSARLSAQQGLSFTEFTYQLLQAYDFYHLNKHYGCTIQVGGSDQWGNIVAGLELIGKLNAPTSRDESSWTAFGITTPLLTTSTGEKFGKSAGNAVWLDSTLTSVFDFYQYFLKVTDADVGKYLKLFTLLSTKEIDELVAAHEEQPERRLAQLRLAAEVTEMVHLGSYLPYICRLSVADAPVRIWCPTGNYANLKAEDIISAFENDPRLAKVAMQDLRETPISKLAAKHGLVSSNSASRALLASRGLYLNNQPIQDPQQRITDKDLLDKKIAILRAGKDKTLILAATDL